jgi:CheY-like chemotaxis protein
MKSGHILVVDDDRSLREALGDGLALEGYEVVCLGDGRAALDHLNRGERPCLILLDLMMPIMDGRTFRHTMLHDPELLDIPVVVITAGGAHVAAGVPAEAILHKPLTIDEVLAVVHEHCGSPCAS